MLDDFSHTARVKLQRDDEETDNSNTAHLNLSLNSFSGSLTNRFSFSNQSQSYNSSISHLSPTTLLAGSSNNNNQYSHDNQQRDHYKQHLANNNQLNQQSSQQHNSNDDHYFTSDETSSSNQNIALTSGASSTAHLKPEANGGRGLLAGAADLGINRQTSVMVPTTAHCSDQHNLHYSISNSKTLTAPSPSNMALNFSHDLLLHQGQSALHQHDIGDNVEHKPSQLELDSGNLMQSAAANMNIWKNTAMNFGLKHEHSFLPASADMNSFSSWTHSGNLNHQSSPNMTHHILDSQHLIGYPQHNQRATTLHLNNHDLVGTSLKSQVRSAEQASFMLNSINHSVASAQTPISNHHTTHQTTDSSHLRGAQSLDTHHGPSSYNLSINDNGQFYNNRSHSSTIKSAVFSHDRQVHMSLTNNHQANHVSYHSSDHLNSQPTTSHHVASSSGSSSKNIGTFRCPHCNELFNMRNLYQSHLKTHSQEKGEYRSTR